MGLSGDFPKLNQLIHALEKHDLFDQMLPVFAEEARRQVLLGFQFERDPYGDPWKGIRRSGKILQDTGRGRNSFLPTAAAQSTGRGIRINSNVGYLRFHQDGTVYLDRRMMVPEQGDLPPIWEEAFRLQGAELLARRLAPERL